MLLKKIGTVIALFCNEIPLIKLVSSITPLDKSRIPKRAISPTLGSTNLIYILIVKCSIILNFHAYN